MMTRNVLRFVACALVATLATGCSTIATVKSLSPSSKADALKESCRKMSPENRFDDKGREVFPECEGVPVAGRAVVQKATAKPVETLKPIRVASASPMVMQSAALPASASPLASTQTPTATLDGYLPLARDAEAAKKFAADNDKYWAKMTSTGNGMNLCRDPSQGLSPEDRKTCEKLSSEEIHELYCSTLKLTTSQCEAWRQKLASGTCSKANIRDFDVLTRMGYWDKAKKVHVVRYGNVARTQNFPTTETSICEIAPDTYVGVVDPIVGCGNPWLIEGVPATPTPKKEACATCDTHRRVTLHFFDESRIPSEYLASINEYRQGHAGFESEISKRLGKQLHGDVKARRASFSKRSHTVRVSLVSEDSNRNMIPESEEVIGELTATMGEVSFDLPLAKANKSLRIVTLGSEFLFGNKQWEERCRKWVCNRADCHQDRLFLTLIARSVVTAQN